MLRDAVEVNQVEEVRKLYEASFPKSEKKPFGFIMKKRKKGFFDVLSIQDGKGHFCGLAIMMLSGGRALLDYLAIAPGCQGGGMGSQVLQELREQYGDDKIVVEIESTRGLVKEDLADNRLRRKAFYLRNGMVPMDYLVDLFGVEMEVLTFGTDLTFGEYHRIYQGALPKVLTKMVKRISQPG